MDEKLYTIPVNDAFDTDCECPVCAMRKKLEDDAIAYTLGPSYMEDDIRAMTDKAGFCDKHMDDLYHQDNRLGLALILSTHFAKINKDVAKLQGSKIKAGGLFKKAEESPLVTYANQCSESCFICDRINNTFGRYVNTIFYLYRTEREFVTKYEQSKGFCMRHYAMLLSGAQKHLSGETLDSFVDKTNRIYLENMKRVQEDLEWYINKFDYRYANEPWKNSKDAIPRAITKVNSKLYDK